MVRNGRSVADGTTRLRKTSSLLQDENRGHARTCQHYLFPRSSDCVKASFPEMCAPPSSPPWLSADSLHVS